MYTTTTNMATEMSSSVKTSTVENIEKVIETQAKLAVVKSTQATVAIGSYNLSLSLTIYAEHEENFARQPISTIKALYERIEALKKFRDSLGLQAQHKDKDIETRQINRYAHAKCKGYSCEFDERALEALPKTTEEKLWDKLITARTTAMSSFLQAALTALTQEDSELSPARKEEFDLQLAKMRRVAAESARMRHFIFSALKEAINLATISFSKTDRKLVEDIKTGRKQNEKKLRKKLAEKTQGKYQALADYFRAGGGMRFLSTDYAFDGEKFRACAPFAQGNGYISEIDFSVPLLSITPEYADASPPCYGKSPKQIQRELILQIRGPLNTYAFIEALMEGADAKNRLEKLCLSGNDLNEQDARALFQLLGCTQIKHLDLSRTTFDSTVFPGLMGAIQESSHLETVNLSEIKIRVPLESDKCCAPKVGFADVLISDEDTAGLLEALKSSRDTLLEVWCHGPKPKVGDTAAHPVISNAAKLSEPLILEIITSFPNLVSYNFSYQKISPDVIGTAAIALLGNEQIIWASLNGTRSEEEHVDSKCCGVRKVRSTLYDEPSAKVLADIKTKTDENLLNVVSTNVKTVVGNMYKKYLASLNTAKRDIEATQAQADQKRLQALRHQETEAHRKQLELAAAGAGKTTNTVFAPHAFTPGFSAGGSRRSSENTSSGMLLLEDGKHYSPR
ncbi:MAG: hypothetical protein KBD78_16205 [Oligoflexales bacterium]|nr:hypothetical protein [Oligoflexales bacterium]